MSLKLHVAQNCGPTARVLAKLLQDNDVTLTEGQADGHVCWGAGADYGSRGLNNTASRYNKLEQLQVLARAGIQTVPVVLPSEIPMLMRRGTDFPFTVPLLARKLAHHGGTDIRYCKGTKSARVALGKGRAFFTRFVPSDTEFRVWVYRKRHLGTYEKVLAHPEMKHRMVGRNYKNGYAFTLVQEASIPRDAVSLALQSIAALGLDFGAVDILRGRDGHSYVLEVNTAPGVEGEGRQVIQSLAKRIAAWEKKGFPERKEAENA